VKIEDESLKQRYERKRDADLGEITKRISQVSVERAYRIIGALESFANRIEKEIIPEIETAVGTWRRRVMVADAVVLIPLLIIFMSYTLSHGYWSGMNFSVPGTGGEDNQIFSYGVLAIVVIIFVLIHFLIRGVMARIYARGLAEEGYYGNLRNAFLKNTQWWRSIFSRSIVGWSHKAQKKISQLRDSADNFIQKLNDQYTNPSGKA
jgi:hypothetical protein